MKQATLILTILLTACADGTTDDDTFGEETADATSSDVGTGTESSSEVSSESGESGSAGDGDNGSADATGDGDGDAGSGDGDSMGDGDGDGPTSETGDGDSGAGEMKFPGDACDPFVDWCIDGYGCDPDDPVMFGPGEFRCLEQSPWPGEDMEYGSLCESSKNCATGLLCTSGFDLPAGDCDLNSGMKCCIDMCVYEETCGNGAACEITWWQADLEDYLDVYVGIGICAAS